MKEFKHISDMKASTFKAILASVLLLAAVTACVNDDMTASDNKVAVKISAGTAMTRAVDNNWEQNDVIGISMLEDGSSDVIAPYNNYSYTTTDGSSNFVPTSAAQIMYFPVDGSKVSFKAYYPYNSSLPAGMIATLSVKDQSSLPDLDFMTAEHLAGTSKDEPGVKLHFYHRLAKVLFDLTTEDNSISLDGCKLVVKGLKTTGTYDIMNEKLSVDAGSTADIPVSIHKGNGNGIFLPREAGAGVSVEVTTANGSKYTAVLKDDIAFKGGYKHTLHIKLSKTPATISATIEEWLEGPETHSNTIRLITGLKDSEGVKEGDTLRLFLKDNADYAYAAKFTYNADGKWTTATPVYWDDITVDPARFIGTTVIDSRLNDTQMDDILISKETSVAPFTGVNLELEHAGAKAIVNLKSSDNTFTKAQLESAVVTFPGYKYAGKVNAKGEFVISDGTKDIIAKDGIAVFPPQTIRKGDIIAKVTIDGRDYEIKADDDNFDFGKGIAKKLVVDMSKTEVKISTKIVPWTEEEHKFDDVRIGSANLAANGGDLKNGDELYIYTGTDANRIGQGEHFTYNTGSDSWNYSDAAHPLRWEDMPAGGNIYASITRPAFSGNSADNQLPDYIIAAPVVNNGGTNGTAINFEMKHCVAKVTVILKSNSFTLDELKAAIVTLPSYKTGAVMDKGVFAPGTVVADIKLPRLTEDETNKYVSDGAYLQPQDVAANSTVVKVTLDGRTYNAQKNEVIKYEAGKATTLIVTLEKTGIAVSATVAGWTDKPSVDLGPILCFDVINSTVTGTPFFNNGDKITMYQIISGTVAGSNNSYSYNNSSISAGSPWYRDDFKKGDAIHAVYPGSPVVSHKQDSFDWTADGGNDHSKDVLVANDGKIGDDAKVSLEFKHALSKVTVNLFTGTGFTDSELATSTVALKDLLTKGTINVVDGKASATSEKATITTKQLDEPNTVGNKGKAAASYEAFILPQTFTVAGSESTLITLILNGQVYNAKVSTTQTFEGGQNYIYNITLSKTGLSFSASVTDWVDNKGGDITIN